MYATDDRYTDDVHYFGGVLRALDLIDYVLYMVAMNALPPVPALWGDGVGATSGAGASTSRRRGCSTGCASRPTSPMWRRGSIRLGPGRRGVRADRRARRCSSPAGPTATATTRSARSSGCACRGAAGRPVEPQGSGRARARARTSTPIARSSPSSTSTSATGQPSSAHARRRSSCAGRRRPEPDLALHDGIVARPRRRGRRPVCAGIEYAPVAPTTTDDRHVDELDGAGDVGMAAWISCAGGLPWGQPLDQRADDARSLTYDWPITRAGRGCSVNASVSLRVRSSAPVAPPVGEVVRCVPRRHVGVDHARDAEPEPRRLLAGRPDRRGRPCTVTGDARTRGSTSRSSSRRRRGRWCPATAAPRHRRERLAQLLAAASHRSRSASTERRSRSALPVVDGLAESTHVFGAGRRTARATRPTVSCGASSTTCWRARPGCTDPYGGRYDGEHGTSIDDVYEGALGVIDRRPGSGVGDGAAPTFTIALAGGDVLDRRHASTSQSDADDDPRRRSTLVATRDGEPFATRAWRETVPPHVLNPRNSEHELSASERGSRHI